MRAFRGFAFIAIVAACATVVLAWDGQPRDRAAPASSQPEPFQAPIPATAWAGLAIFSGIVAVRLYRRRHH